MFPIFTPGNVSATPASSQGDRRGWPVRFGRHGVEGGRSVDGPKRYRGNASRLRHQAESRSVWRCGMGVC